MNSHLNCTKPCYICIQIDYSMKHKSHFQRLGVVFIAALLWVAPRLFAQDAGRAWALKAGVGGIFTGHISGEVEVFLKGRVSIAVRGALIRPTLDSLRSPAEGFFIKAGPKFYFSKEKAASLAGFAIKPEVVFSYWRNWNRRPYTVKIWEYAIGAVGSISYGWKPFEHVLIEPHVGIGIVPTFEDVISIDDQPPFAQHKQPLWLLYRDEIKGGVHSHLPISNFVAISGGINIGIQF
jgi:hypothetical protein